MNLLGGSVSTLGNMNRAVPSVHNPNVGASDVKPTPRNEPSSTPDKKPRRSSSAAALSASAWHSPAWPASAARRPSAFRLARASAAGALSAASAFDIGPGFTPMCAASARMLPVSFGAAGAAGSRCLRELWPPRRAWQQVFLLAPEQPPVSRRRRLGAAAGAAAGSFARAAASISATLNPRRRRLGGRLGRGRFRGGSAQRARLRLAVSAATSGGAAAQRCCFGGCRASALGGVGFARCSQDLGDRSFFFLRHAQMPSGLT